MPLFQVIVLAVVQGVTEFLPISSTAHLALIPRLLHWTDPGLTFDVALHVGTLAAILLYFFRTWIDLLLLGFGLNPVFSNPASQTDRETGTENELSGALFWFLVAGTVPGAIAGEIFHEQAESTWRKPLVIGSALILVALVMAWGEKAGRQKKDMRSVSLADSLWIGLSQALALVPGVSRSGITITAGLFRDLRRETSARFSFLLSTPIIAGAALKEFLAFPHHRIPQAMQMPFFWGALISALVGYATISLFLKFLQFGTFKIFIYYRIIFGIIVIALAFFFQSGIGL